MRKAIAIGTALFLVVLIVRAPASLLTRFVPPDQPVKLLDTGGTIWSGGGDLLVEGREVGRLIWSFKPVTLIRGRIGYDLSISGSQVQLAGALMAGTSDAEATVSGDIAGDFVALWLAPYDIELGGDFAAHDVAVRLDGQWLDDIAGSLTWSGGPVTYILAGKVYRATLPRMRAELGPGPRAVAFAEGVATPLLHAELKPDGFAKIGVTKYLTKLTGILGQEVIRITRLCWW